MQHNSQAHLFQIQVKSLIKTLKCLQSDDKYQALLFLISAIKLYVKFLYNDSQERIYKPSILKELNNIQNVIIANLLKCRSAAAGSSSSSSAVASCELRTSIRNHGGPDPLASSDGILLLHHRSNFKGLPLVRFDIRGKLRRGGLFDGIPLTGAVTINIRTRQRLGTILGSGFGSIQLNRSLVRLIASRNFKLLFNMFEQNVFPTWKMFKENRPVGRTRTRPSMPAICYSGGSSHSPPAAYIKKDDFDFDAPYSLAVDDPCFEELKLELSSDEDDSISNEIFSEESSTNNTSLMLSSDTNTLDTNDSNMLSGERSKEQVYQCLICDKSYRKRKSLVIHFSHHPGFCPDCGKQRGVTSGEIIEHNRVYHKNRPHICEHCGETFTRNQQYQVHVQGHFQGKALVQEQNCKKAYKYSCRSCGIVFNNQKYLEKHVQKTGHQAEGVVCETCGAVFSSNIKLHQHVARTHKNEKRFTCEHCSKVFNQKANLDRHLLLHTNITEKNYPCEQCSASYLSMASLREHIKIAHIGDEKFECNICHKLFAAKRSLKRHKLCHSEERPFPCTVENCKEAYKNQSHLVRHMKTAHHIETPPKRVQKVVKNEQGEFVPLDPIGTGDSSASKSNSAAGAVSIKKQQQQQTLIGVSDKSIGDSSTNFSDNMSTFNYDYVENAIPAAAVAVDQGQHRLQMLGPSMGAAANSRMSVPGSASAVGSFSDPSLGYGGIGQQQQQQQQQSTSDHFEWQNLEFGGGNGPGSSQQQQQQLMGLDQMNQGYLDSANSKGYIAGGGMPGMRVYPDPNLICEHCDETNFLNGQQLQLHIQDHFSAKDGKDPPGKKLLRLHCKTCNLVFATGPQLDRHIQKTNHHTDSIACDLCSAIFNSNLKVYQHMLKCHKNETWYACEQCSKVFILKQEYDKHQLVHQTVTDKSVICEHCASSFFSQEALKEHIKISHTVEKKYECNICNKLFAAKRSLKRHKLCHEEEGAFPCPVEDCKESFKTPTSLAKHKKMVHSIGPDPTEKGTKGAKAAASTSAKAASEKQLLPEPPPVAAQGPASAGGPIGMGVGVGASSNVAGPSVGIKLEPRTPTGLLVPPSRTSSTSSAGAGSNPNTIPYDPYGTGMHYNNVMGQGQQQQQQTHFSGALNPASGLHYPGGGGGVAAGGRPSAEQSMAYRMDPANTGQYGHSAATGAGYGAMNSSFEWRNMDLQNSIDAGMGPSGTTSGGSGQSVQSVAASMKANKYYPVMDANSGAGAGFIQSQPSQQQQQQQQQPPQQIHGIKHEATDVYHAQQHAHHQVQVQQQQQVKQESQQMMGMNNQEFMGYQEIWNANMVKMEYQDEVNSSNVSGNSYNNIGNILSNLELIGNNSNYEQTYDIVPPSTSGDQQQQQPSQQQNQPQQQQQQQVAQTAGHAHQQSQATPKNSYHKQQHVHQQQQQQAAMMGVDNPIMSQHHHHQQQQQYFQEPHHPSHQQHHAGHGLHHHAQMHGHHSQQQQQTPSPHHHPPHMQQFQGSQQQQQQQLQQHQYSTHLPHHPHQQQQHAHHHPHASGPSGSIGHHVAAGPSVGHPHQLAHHPSQQQHPAAAAAAMGYPGQQHPGQHPQQQQQQQDHTLTDISKTNNLQFVDSFTESIDYLQQSFQYV